MLPRNPCTGLLGCSPLTTFFFSPFAVVPPVYVRYSFAQSAEWGDGLRQTVVCGEKKHVGRECTEDGRARGVGPAYVCNGLGVWELLSFLFWLSEDRGNLRCHA